MLLKSILASYIKRTHCIVQTLLLSSFATSALFLLPHTGMTAPLTSPTEKNQRYGRTIQKTSSLTHQSTTRKHTIEASNDRYQIFIEYPSLGIEKIDKEIALWAISRADTFITALDEIPESDTSRFRLSIAYQLTHVSDHCVSIVYYITTQTGSIYGEQGLATFTYELNSQTPVSYEDIFAEPKDLIPYLSHYSFETLSQKLFARLSLSLVHDGTYPDLVNFAFFSLSPEGLTLYFPPKQVADDAYGTQTVTIPLSKLEKFKPRRDLWANTHKSPFAK